jgi:uncharacterized protein (DUF1684 family)
MGIAIRSGSQFALPFVGAGRFLEVGASNEDGVTFIDFNRAYNPPCAFNEFAAGRSA